MAVSGPESELLTRVRCDDLFSAAVRHARSFGVADVEAILEASDAALTRFANNTIHQNVAERSRHLSVRLLVDGRTARASTNRLDDDSIRSVVEQAVDIARLQEPDPELPPLAPPANLRATARLFAATAGVRPSERAGAVAEAIEEVRAASQTAAGIYSTGESVFAVLNSRGVFAYHAESMARFSITAMTGDSSGWAKGSACYHGDLNPRALAQSAVRKAAASRAPAELPPGRYTVVLEPAAVLDIAGQIFGDFGATAIRDGRSFLRDRVGTRLFGENVTIHDDVYHPLQAGPPFDGEGVPRQRLTLVEKGVIREIPYSRQAAQRESLHPTGHGFPVPNEYGEAPGNPVITGGEMPLEQMIASTARGILVTRLWYIREVDVYEKIMTGMTRDGTFLIEDGRIAAGLRNFRFNQSLIEMLQNVEQISPAARTSGEEAPDMVVPAMKVQDFHFTEVTRF